MVNSDRIRGWRLEVAQQKWVDLLAQVKMGINAIAVVEVETFNVMTGNRNVGRSLREAQSRLVISPSRDGLVIEVRNKQKPKVYEWLFTQVQKLNSDRVRDVGVVVDDEVIRVGKEDVWVLQDMASVVWNGLESYEQNELSDKGRSPDTINQVSQSEA